MFSHKYHTYTLKLYVCGFGLGKKLQCCIIVKRTRI
jgi:hypothetical protein